MDRHSDHQKQLESQSNESMTAKPLEAEEFVAPGVPIVRSSTSRPPSFSLFSSSSSAQHPQAGQKAVRSAATDFPAEAPTAPPLPEECEEMESDVLEEPVLPSPGDANVPAPVASEFVWLFEYGLDMDATVLNSVERLNGAALLYGPAVLKGYQLALGVVEFHIWRTAATLLPSSKPGAEVWGVLYRIPRRLIERQESDLSLLDKMHSPEHFEPVEVVVYEPHRKRNITCITYIASQNIRHKFHFLSQTTETLNAAYIQRLVEYAKRQQLPESYIQELALQRDTKADIHPPVASPLNKKNSKRESQDLSEQISQVREQNTEPLPIVKEAINRGDTTKEGQENLENPQAVRIEEQAGQRMQPNSWLMAFALYLVFLLLLALTFSVVQSLGFWREVFTLHFAPLGAPWFVLVDGLLGGCISSILILGNFGSALEKNREKVSRGEEPAGTGWGIYSAHPPAFVMVTWFTHPFIGAILAAGAYLLLNSGLFTLNGTIEQHYALFSLVGAAAGLCQGLLFFKRARYRI